MEVVHFSFNCSLENKSNLQYGNVVVSLPYASESFDFSAYFILMHGATMYATFFAC